MNQFVCSTSVNFAVAPTIAIRIRVHRRSKPPVLYANLQLTEMSFSACKGASEMYVPPLFNAYNVCFIKASLILLVCYQVALFLQNGCKNRCKQAGTFKYWFGIY